MKIIGRMSDETRRKILDTVDTLLREEHVSVTYARGIKWRDDYDSGQRRAEPTDGWTLTIEVNGGAQEVEESDEEKLQQLLRLMNL